MAILCAMVGILVDVGRISWKVWRIYVDSVLWYAYIDVNNLIDVSLIRQ